MIAEPSKDLIEDYQILALMLGKRTNLRPFDGHVYKLYFSDKSDGMVRKALKVSDKEENVWCIQTELGTFIARRNGKPFITHNCEIFYTGVIKRRPVYLLSTAPEVCEHPWIIFATRYGKICKTLDELIKVLERKYG